MVSSKHPSSWSGSDISLLVGRTLARVDNLDNAEIRFTTDSGDIYALYHNQDCCESVYVEDVIGDLADLIGSPILSAELVTSNENPEGVDPPEEYQDSFTWSFYKLATIKGSVTIRWYGESNGYYSEEVTFAKLTPIS